MNLVFQGKTKTDSEESFHELLTFLISEKSQSRNLTRLLNLIDKEPLINRDNAYIFFDIFKPESKVVQTSEITLGIYLAFEKLFLELNTESGAFKTALSNDSYLVLVKKRKNSIF